MKNLTSWLIATLVTTSPIILKAQEIIPRREAVRIANYLNYDLSIFETTPIPSDADVKRPVGYREGEYAALIVPESKLSSEAFTYIKKNGIIPVGQIWLHKLVPVKNGEAIQEDRFQKFPITIGEVTYNVFLCLLGARKSSDDSFELLIFGKDKEPLLIVPLKKAESKQEMPIQADVQIENYSAKITLKLLGKYSADFEITASN